MAKEGKSMTAANLAISFAQLGQKVLLIDADFHQGHQHRTFKVPSSPGLGGVVEGEVSCDGACHPSGIPNLDIMPKDRKGRNIPELLSRPSFGQAMKELRKRYDRIIVDSPPVLGLSETCVLTPHVDGVVFILWSSHTPVSQMKAALKTLAANGAQVFGCVVNRLDLGVATNYYYYYYYSDYYYNSYHQVPHQLDGDADGDGPAEIEVGRV
jgi:capsular exopolysaccharide synthesis family protein